MLNSCKYNFFSYLCSCMTGRPIVAGRITETKTGMMEKLTLREEELMRCFWEHGPLFVRELVALATEPKPHFNTLSTLVRALEAKGNVAHKTFGSTNQNYPVVTE